MDVSGWNSAEMPLIGDFAVFDERRFMGGKNRHLKISRMRGLAWGPTFSPGSASKSWPKKSLQTTSFAISVHHFSMSAEPARASRSILATKVRTLALISSSHFKIVDFEKPLPKEPPALSMGLWVAHIEHASESFVD